MYTTLQFAPVYIPNNVFVEKHIWFLDTFGYVDPF